MVKFFFCTNYIQMWLTGSSSTHKHVWKTMLQSLSHNVSWTVRWYHLPAMEFPLSLMLSFHPTSPHHWSLHKSNSIPMTELKQQKTTRLKKTTTTKKHQRVFFNLFYHLGNQIQDNTWHWEGCDEDWAKLFPFHWILDK